MSSGGRARLFVALELPTAARVALEQWGDSAVRGKAGVRLLAAESLHATLCFLGWREVSEIEPISAACEAAIRGEGAPQLEFGPAVWLPPRRPRVLAVRIEDHAGALARLQESVAAALSAGGWYVREARPFMGHVTVARLGRGIRVGTLELPAAPSSTFVGTTVTLFRSRLGREGARYEALRAVELGEGMQ